jgi:rhamnose utilization protein RhaD (predicted bifunctional aldolase and dehydrogenase)/NAD(P)-dependent dehydrogenase (short-subunit alcohol dehydrogenase family)
MKDNWPKFDDNATLVDKLVGISRHYGADPRFVLAGGGNTSAKTDKVLYVKASGRALATIDADGLVPMDRAKLDALLQQDLGKDPIERERRFKEGVLAALLEPEKGLRPSVECLLHNLLPQTFVVHTHHSDANALTCCVRGEQLVRELFGEAVVWIPATEPGHTLVRPIAEALRRHKARTGAPGPDAIIMQNHGLLICGDEPDEIRDRTDAIIGKCRKCVKAAGDRPAFGRVTRIEGETAGKLINVIAPALRGLLAEGPDLKIVTFDDSDLSASLACGADGAAATALGPLTPDQIVYCGSFPMWFEPPGDESDEQIVQRLRKAVSDHKAKWNDSPMVVLVKGVGMFAAGDDFAWADNARVVYLNAIEVMAAARGLGGILPMTQEHRRFIESWEAEAYRKRVAKAAVAAGRAANKVAVVTGAAQGFGLEIAQDLAGQGAYVALTDVNVQGAAQAAEAICAQHGCGRATGLAIDVTDGESIRQALHQVVRKYGGFDVLVSNAGVLKAQSVKTQPAKDFEFVTAVNYKGYFLCVQNAAPIMAVQHMARADCMSDIIQINSKSGLAGSNRNAAYAGSKFGGIGLTQSFAMELIADGIKVNAICPGNFFDGPLWSDPDNGLFVQYLRAKKVPGAKTIADVRRAYEAKVPMGRGCETADVMIAIYYVMEQKYETGQALPVTGGQVMLS